MTKEQLAAAKKAAMKTAKPAAKTNNNSVTVELDLLPEPRLSSSGKSLLLATGKDTLEVAGSTANIQYNIFVPLSKQETRGLT